MCPRGTCFRYCRLLLQMGWFRTESTGDRKYKRPITLNFYFIHLSIRILETGQNTFFQSSMSEVSKQQWRQVTSSTVIISFYSISLTRRLCKTPKNDYQFHRVCLTDRLSARPPALMKQLVSHWTVFHEIWYLSIFIKPVEKIQVSLQSNENNWYFTWRPSTFWIPSRSFFPRMIKFFGQNL